MTFIESVETCFKKYGTLQGRATRSEFWWFHLFYILSSLIIALIVSYLIEIGFKDIALILGVVMVLSIFIPAISVSVRRLHDIGKSGYWYFISFIPYIGGIILTIFFIIDSKEDNKYPKKIKNIFQQK